MVVSTNSVMMVHCHTNVYGIIVELCYIRTGVQFCFCRLRFTGSRAILSGPAGGVVRID